MYLYLVWYTVYVYRHTVTEVPCHIMIVSVLCRYNYNSTSTVS